MGSQGRIEFDTTAEQQEPMEFQRTFIPDATGSATEVDPAELSDLDRLQAEDFADTEPTGPIGATSATEPLEPEFITDAFEPRAGEPTEAYETLPMSEFERPAFDEAAPRTAPVEAATRAQRLARAPREPRAPRRPMRRMAILGGAEGAVLDQVPTETPRYVQMFFVLLGTAVVSALSMFFALLTGVRVAVWLAIPLAIIWALIIFNLDRFLTSTMKSTRQIGKLIGLAIPRVIMAAIIGIVVAEPLVLQIFQNDIQREVTSTNITQSLSDQKALETGPEKKALDAATAKVAALENQSATGIVAGADSATATEKAAQSSVDSLTSQMADQQKVIDQARQMYQCELNGGTEVAGCTGVAGEGTSSDAAKAQLQQAQSTYDALAAQLRDAQAALTAAQTSGKDAASASEKTNRQQAQDQLPAAQKSYDAALAAYNARAASVATGNADAVGLLSQITGLNRLSEKEPTLGWAHWLIAALFFMIELLPVLVKVLTSHGDKTLYEKAEEVEKSIAEDRVVRRGFHERAAIATDTPISAV